MSAKRSPFIVGTSGWSYPHWKGIFYPDDIPKTRWFDFYAGVFSAVEINATFYRFFGEGTYRKWRDRAPEGFLYVLKAPRLITHRKALLHVESLVEDFSRTASLLGGRLGLILLQLAPSLPYDPKRLEKALAAFGNPEKVAVEFRHEKWLTGETRALLEKMGACFCAADSPKTPLLDWMTGPAAYIRLHGRKSWYCHDYSSRELAEIARLARSMAARGAERVFVFFNNDYRGYAPENARRLMTLLDPRKKTRKSPRPPSPGGTAPEKPPATALKKNRPESSLKKPPATALKKTARNRP